jgi:hypothetical protein
MGRVAVIPPDEKVFGSNGAGGWSVPPSGFFNE